MSVTITTNLSELNKVMGQYAAITKKLPAEVLEKQGGKLGFALTQELRGLAPPKGSIRAAGLARLSSGAGIRVRPSVLRAVYAKHGAATTIADRRLAFGKTKGLKGVKGPRRLNLRALAVQAELNVRERGRGFLAQSARFPRELQGGARTYSRFRDVLGDADLKATRQGAELHFHWGGQSRLSFEAAAGLSRPRGEAAIARAIKVTAEDIALYVNRKLFESGKDLSRSFARLK